MRVRIPRLAVLAVLLAEIAWAESGQWLNIHLEPGAAVPIEATAGELGSGVFLKVDVPFFHRLAAQASVGALSFQQSQSFLSGTLRGGGIGLRFRLINDESGYLWHFGDEGASGHRGNLFGNVWIDANVLFMGGNEARVALDTGLGLELSLIDAVQLGPYMKLLTFGSEHVVAMGLSLSVGIPDTTHHEMDVDRDGIPNERDQCPNDPEDKDGFEDSDGCPDRDNDRDGVPDDRDRCPTLPEDADGFEDEDGCPDEDDDRDGVPDKSDRCPRQPEDRDGFEDSDGCPDQDNDRDGLADPDDRCPDHPEDLDGFEDNDGCPDPDNDQDGIADPQDKCPLRPETRNGIDDEDGCPEERAKVFVENKRVVITEKIFFQFNKAKILPRSFPILDSVAQVLDRFPQIRRLQIEGHTDDVGTDEYNQKLSEDRARAVVDYLTAKGVAPERLEPIGYGKTRPLAEGTTERAREQNRRVEFTIVDPAGGVVPVIVTPGLDSTPVEGQPDGGVIIPADGGMEGPGFILEDAPDAGVPPTER